MAQQIFRSFALGCGLLLLSLSSSYAQASRTWVSGVGDDANPCSRTAPCKTFAGAISKTAASGEISVLDPGGYGAVTITKSISIVSEGSEGSILACNTNGININAAPTDVINLHGIFIEGCGNGLLGVNIISAAQVHLRKCLIRGFNSGSGAGVSITTPSSSIKVTVSDCTVANNRTGVIGNPSGPGRAAVVLDHAVIDGNTTSGVLASNARATFFISNSAVTNNGTGLNSMGTSQIISSGNNVIANNATNGAPTSTQPLQ